MVLTCDLRKTLGTHKRILNWQIPPDCPEGGENEPAADEESDQSDGTDDNGGYPPR